MKNFFLKSPIAVKLLIPAAMLLCAIGVFIYIFFPLQFEKDEYNSIVEKAKTIAELSVNQFTAQLNSKNNLSAQEFAETIGQTDRVQYIVITSDDGTVTGAFQLKEAETFAYKDDEESGGSIIKVRKPISDGKKIIGRFYLGFSTGDLEERTDQYRSNLMMICGILSLSGVLLMVVIVMIVTYPLRTIVAEAQHALTGDLHERLSTPFSDETGKIAHVINSMLKNSGAIHQQVESLTRILEKRDQQLTNEVKQRELVEKQIQLSDEIINKVNALIIVFDGDGGIVYASPSFNHVMGYKPEELLRDGWWKIINPDAIERTKERKKISKLARGESPDTQIPYERQVIDARGNLRWILWQDTRGFNNTLIGVGQDITERKIAEEQIREQAALLDITGDAIMVRNLDHRILFWNNGAETLYGFSSADAAGKMADELFGQESSAGIGIAYSNVIENGSWTGELKQVTHSGKDLIVESRWTLMNDDFNKPKSILVVNTDVTEQRNLESQFRRAQRLENIGTLAGGIAHDLNNVLSPILMAISALKKRHEDEKTTHLLSVIDLSARRGADIVKQVLTFARGTEGERTLLQPKHILREIEGITRETFPKSIEIKTDIATHLWTVIGDATQLHQIFLNLFVNARDAMPEGGTLSLKATNVTLDEEGVRHHLNAKPGNYVVFSVKDTGTGIPAEIMDKIFNPFFTTKEVGKGTGLGLSTVTSIVKSYNGFIAIDSTVGKGTEFSIYIPATNSDSAQLQDEKRAPLPTGRGESILVVDDELSIREITKETLEAYGYRVQTAKDGIEALSLIEKDPRKFSLVLTDMMMPNMDGGSLIRTLERLAPDIKIVAVSGITDPVVLEKIKKSRIEAFLPKPVQSDNLLRILDAALHSDGAEPKTTGDGQKKKRLI